MAVLAMALTLLMFFVGLVGTVLPLLPGVTLIYGGMLLYGIMTQFTTLGVNFYLVQGMAVILIFAVDFLATAAGTKRFGGSRYAAWGAAFGVILGVIIFGPFGIILGPFLGAVVAELIMRKEPNQAVKVGFGTIIGLLGGTVLKLLIEIIMIISFFLNI